jgi:hypothetical protein
VWKNLKGEVMDESKLNKLDDLTLNINLDLSVLNSALKDDNGDLQLCALSNFVEKIYNDSNNIRNLF